MMSTFPATGTPDRVATIDVGTNTALLLVAERTGDGLRVCATEDRFVRLGAGVDEHRRIQPEAMTRLREALLAYKTTAARWGASTIIVAATSASRDAKNSQELVDFVRDETGLSYEILSGEEEALWSFNGALSDLPPRPGLVATLDIGGGSTERVVGAWDAAAGVWRVHDAVSFDLGGVRLTERFFTSQPPAPAEIDAAAAWVRQTLATADLTVPEDTLLLGASGTTTSLALIAQGVSRWEDLPDPRPVLRLEDVERWRTRLMAHSFEEVLAINPAVMNGRADVFPAGLLILETVMRLSGTPTIRAAHRGLRHGLALRHWRGLAGV
ncbi:MAG: exopolyphosphatase [Rhodothermales bacterium]|nr:exopolyphosphatase [Rhodothermales bacterium]